MYTYLQRAPDEKTSKWDDHRTGTTTEKTGTTTELRGKLTAGWTFQQQLYELKAARGAPPRVFS